MPSSTNENEKSIINNEEVEQNGNTKIDELFNHDISNLSQDQIRDIILPPQSDNGIEAIDIHFTKNQVNDKKEKGSIDQGYPTIFTH